MKYKILNGYEITVQQFWNAISINDDSSQETIQNKYNEIFKKFSITRDSLLIIFNENGETCGYICFFPITAKLHNELINGDLNITIDDIIKNNTTGWSLDDKNYIHIVSICIKESLQDTDVVKYLSSEFCKHLYEKKSRGINISDITSFATNWCGNKWLQLHGFHKERETKEDTVMRCCGEDLKELLAGKYNHPADTVYFVTAVSIERKTDDSLKKEHQINNLKYDRNDSYDKFLKFLKSWDNDKYYTSSFLSSVHTNFNEAKKYVENNIGDINECGSYEYAVVSAVKCGVSYYNSEQNREDDFWVYKFNHENYKYEPLDKSSDEYDYVVKEVWGFICAKSE